MNRPWLLPVIGLLLVPVLSPHSPRASDSQSPRVRLIDPGRTTNDPKTRFYLQARNVDERDVIALRERLVSGGAERVNLFVPAMIIVCEVPETMDIRKLVGDARVAVVEESSADVEASAAAEGSEDLRLIKACYEKVSETRTPEAPVSADVSMDGGFDDVVRLVAPEVVEESKARAKARAAAAPGAAADVRNIQQNSEFLVGSVLVQLVFPESDGHGEDWTDRMIADATSGAYAAALDYQAKFAYAPISFTFKTDKRVPTEYEPIRTSMDQHALWIKDTMWYLKVPIDESADLMVHEFNNTWREYYRTNWVFTAFIANSTNDIDHRFPDPFYLAYAMLGGPYLVIPQPAGSNPSRIDPWLLFSTVFQHEMAHMFWALDEYGDPENRWTCDSHTGYLDYYNDNKVDPNLPMSPACHGPALPCLMLDFEWNPGRPVCQYTQGHIGVIDHDRNSIPDVFDVGPTVEFESADAETILTPDVTIRMRAFSEAVPNQNPFQVPEDRVNYAPPLKDAKVTVGGIASFRVDPVDGEWGGVEEDLVVSISGLASGLNLVGVVVRNTLGKASETFYKSFYYIGINFALFRASPDNDGTHNDIQISWKTVGDTFGATFDLFRIDTSSGEPDTTCLALDVEGTPEPGGMFCGYEFLDTDVSAGRSYWYFVKGSFDIEGSGANTHYEVTSAAFEVQGMYPIYNGQLASLAYPNPLRGRTQVSVRIPETRTVVGGDGYVGTGTSQLTETPVSVTVFDVAGRLVKRVYDGRLYGGVRTFEWDGTNEDNERVRSGVYFVKAVAGPSTDVRKVVVVR